MNKLYFAIATALIASSTNASLPFNELDDSSMRSMVAMNYCSYSLSVIQHYKNRILLDNQYDEIINNINLKNIPDDDTINVIQQVLDGLTAFRLNEMEKDFLRQDALEKQQMAMFDTLRTGSQAAFAIGTLGSGGNLASLAGQVIDTFESYNNMVAADYRAKEGEYNIAREELQKINELSKTFLEKYWNLLRSTDLSDSYRVTQKDLDLLLETASESVMIARYQRLKLNENRLQFIPEYWSYRGNAAFSLWQTNKSKDLAADIKYCLEQYSFFKGFLRIDPFEAELKMYRIATGELPAAEATRLVDEILKVYPDDPAKILFGGLTAIQYGDFDKAAKLLQLNIDLGQLEIISRTLLAGILDGRKDEEELVRLLEDVLNKESASNQEILYLMSRFKPQEKFVTRFIPEINNIQLSVDHSLYGEDGLTLSLPYRWFFDLDNQNKATIDLEGQHFEAAEQSLSEDGKSYLVSFKKVAKEKELLTHKENKVILHIPTNYFPVTLKGDISPVEVVDDGKITKIKSFISTTNPFGDKEKSKPEESMKSVLQFNLQEICSGEE